GPGDSPRDGNNTKTVAAATTSTAVTSSGSTSSTMSTAKTSTGATGGGASSMAAGKATFTSTCGGCHTLADAGTHGSVGPNLDQLKPSDALVAHQIANGGASMPAGLLKGTQLTEVAKYVSSVAGKGKSSSSGAGGAP
ncbi:MAG: cytochrome c, partial [Gaiellales bacterium]